MAAPITDETIEWRAGTALRASAYCVIGGACLAFLLIAIGVGEPGVALVVAGAYGVISYRMWAQILRPRVVVGAESIEIRNGRRSATISLRDVYFCSPGYDGLTIRCGDGSVHVAPYPQKWNLSGWIGRRTKADDATKLIMERADRARAR
jgi:hypothetical protein